METLKSFFFADQGQGEGQRKSRFGQYDFSVGSPAGKNGSLINPAEWDLERPHPTKAENVFLYGAHPETGEGFILRINHRLRGSSTVRLQIRTADGRLYELSEGVELKDPPQELSEYRFPGICLEVVKPCRLYRLVVRSYATRVDQPGSVDPVFVRMRTLIFAMSDIFDDQDVESLVHNEAPLDRYQQLINVKGKLWIESEPEADLHLWGCRSKTFENEVSRRRRLVTLFGYDQYGYAFSLTSHYDQDSRFLGTQGFAFDVLHYDVMKDGDVKSVQLDEKRIQGKGWTEKIYLSREWNVKINPGRDSTAWFQSMELTIEGQDQPHVGIALITSSSSCESSNAAYRPIGSAARLENGSQTPLVVNLQVDDALNLSLTGGKGHSLARLIRQSRKYDSGFTVPAGFVITSEAYHRTIQLNGTLCTAIEDLQAASGDQRLKGSLDAKCAQIQRLIKDVTIPQVLIQLVKSEFAQKMTNRFAVRSSGCGFEDSEDLSAAGQMETFLGVNVLIDGDRSELWNAIRSCWASQFSRVAVEYKRGYGLPLDSKMAVVVQEMVPLVKCAGVLFTCDPLTGDERVISISGNFGLGESVVSASTEPDTILVGVSVRRDDERRLKGIKEIKIGNKENQVVQTISGTKTVDLESRLRAACCLTEGEILRLSSIALRIAKLSSPGPCDMEWAISQDGRIFLLQCRPLTNLDRQWSAWEVAHEGDTPFESPHEFFTSANVGEVMPSQMSRMGVTILNALLGSAVYSMKHLFGGSIRYMHRTYSECMVSMLAGNALFHVSRGSFGITADDSPMSRSIQLCLFGGYLTENQDFLRITRTRVPEATSIAERVQDGLHKVRKAFDGLLMWSGTTTEGEAKQIFVECAALLDRVKTCGPDEIRQAWNLTLELFRKSKFVGKGHADVTLSSTVANMVVLAVLKHINDTSDEELLGHLTVLLGNVGGVLSGDCPTALRRIAEAIEEPEHFLGLTSDEALDKLQNGPSQASQHFNNFLEQYSHRGYMELDVAWPRWDEKKHDLIDSIQMLLQCQNGQQKTRPAISGHRDAVLEEVLSGLPYVRRLLAKYVAIPLAKKRIRAREWYKSKLIHSMTLLRGCMLHIGTLLQHSGRLPDAELVFHMSINELNDVIALLANGEDFYPRFIQRIKMRKRLFETNKDVRYPLYMAGTKLESIQETEERESASAKNGQHNGAEFVLSGSPVYAGKVRGRAFVARTIEELKNSEVPLQHGDILVTRGTDIAWSPVFPLLGGLITEIGGICSHGAVIAREFALPCLIGVPGATSKFQTGQQVELDSQSTNSVKLC